MLCQDYRPNVRSLRIIIRTALLPQCRLCGAIGTRANSNDSLLRVGNALSSHSTEGEDVLRVAVAHMRIDLLKSLFSWQRISSFLLIFSS